MSFFEKWTTDIWPVVEKKYNALQKVRPAKQDTATGNHYGDKVYEFLKTKREVRNISCNLTWTSPVENTSLQSNISMATVERFALDMYVNTVVASPATAAGSAATVAGSAATAVAGSAATTGGEISGEGEGVHHTVRALLQSSQKKWKIPERVPRGYEMQIAVVTTANEPTRGNFRRMSLDVVVNATWLAMKWAIESKDAVAEEALSNLITDWPFDFHLFEGADAELQIMKRIISLPAATERLRDFCGLDQGNLMRMAAEVRKVIHRETPGKLAASADDVHKWMKDPDNINWGLYHLPSLRTVRDLLRNWDALNKIPQALTILDQAKCEFGRDSLFESPTKVQICLEKGAHNPVLIVYIMEMLFTYMLRKRAKNPFSTAELKEKGGTVDVLLWQRRYVSHLQKEYPDMFKVAESAAKCVTTLQQVVLSPLAMYELTEGDARDLTFVQALPNEPLRLYFKHVQDIVNGYYQSELKGALTSTNTQWPWAKFHESERVKRRFLEDFTTAYDTVAFKQDVVAESAAAVAESAAKELPVPETQKPKKGEKQARMAEFRREAELAVSSEINSRMVVLTQDGTHQEVSARLSATRLYQNLTEQGRFMAFYDVKNAKLMERRQSETIVQREPLIDMEKFTAFCQVASNVLKPGCDFVWILAGKSDFNVQRIRQKVAEFGWKDKAVHLVYDFKISHKWYVKKMRGMANSKSYEKAILCWKGKFPSGLPKDRQYVDVGSALYVDTMLKVPVLHPKDLTYVDMSVLAESLKTMCGLAEEVALDDPDVAESAAPGADSAALVADSAASLRPLQEYVKKRRLYRSTTDESVVWFPHDNHPDLLKEFVWESGSPRWVLHGTPASGAGLIGCLETGVSVIALCENAHHQRHLDIALRERAVEAMLAGSRVFKDEALQARALEFCPTATSVKKDNPPKNDDAPTKEDGAPEPESSSDDSEKNNKKKKKRKNKKAKKNKKMDGKKKRKFQSQSGSGSGDSGSGSSSL